MTNSKKMKILLELMHGMGDTVCALPMLKVLRMSFPNSEITVLTKFASAADIIEASHIAVDHIVCLDIYKDIGRSLSVLWELRKSKFEYGISSCITPVRKANLFMKIVNPKHIVGWQKQHLFFDLLEDKYHFVEANLLSIQEICDIPQGKMYPEIYPDEMSTAKIKAEIGAENAKRKIIGICIGNADYSLKNRFLRTGKVYTRSWGIQNMAALIQLLVQENVTIALIGGKAEIPLVDYIRKHVPASPKIIDFVGKTTIKESIALASLCDCVFGVDTGMQHIAAAVGTKTVSVFGPTNFHTHGAYSECAKFLVNKSCCPTQYCYGTSNYVNCPENRKCLTSISPERAFIEVKDILFDK